MEILKNDLQGMQLGLHSGMKCEVNYAPTPNRLGFI